MRLAPSRRRSTRPPRTIRSTRRSPLYGALASYDLGLIAAALLLCVLGLAIIRSADLHNAQAHGEAAHQALFVVIGIAVGTWFAVTDFQRMRRYAVWLYVLNAALLAIVMHAGHAALGAQRWLSLGPLGTFQPSEPAKLIVAISFAAYFARRPVTRARDLLPALALLAPPALLIVKQPDLGTAIVLVAVFSVELFFASRRASAFALYLAGLVAAAAVTIGTNVLLKPFQRDRLLVFLHPNTDLQGVGYNLHQAKIAIGSGGIFGKGLTLGTQTQLGFVPEHSRDFVFTVVGEELGFIGALATLALFAFVLFRALAAIGDARDARDAFGTYLAAGITAMLASHVIINVGMTIGVMPITGIPLPFVSYGGSAIITDCAAVGLLLNIRMQRRRTRF